MLCSGTGLLCPGPGLLYSGSGLLPAALLSTADLSATRLLSVTPVWMPEALLSATMCTSTMLCPGRCSLLRNSCLRSLRLWFSLRVRRSCQRTTLVLIPSVNTPVNRTWPDLFGSGLFLLPVTRPSMQQRTHCRRMAENNDEFSRLWGVELQVRMSSAEIPIAERFVVCSVVPAEPPY